MQGLRNGQSLAFSSVVTISHTKNESERESTHQIHLWKICARTVSCETVLGESGQISYIGYGMSHFSRVLFHLKDKFKSIIRFLVNSWA